MVARKSRMLSNSTSHHKPKSLIYFSSGKYSLVSKPIVSETSGFSNLASGLILIKGASSNRKMSFNVLNSV